MSSILLLLRYLHLLVFLNSRLRHDITVSSPIITCLHFRVSFPLHVFFICLLRLFSLTYFRRVRIRLVQWHQCCDRACPSLPRLSFPVCSYHFCCMSTYLLLMPSPFLHYTPSASASAFFANTFIGVYHFLYLQHSQ